MTARSVILQETLDVVALGVRPGRIGQAAAQFLQDPAHPVDVDFAGNHLRELVAEFVRAQRPSQRVGAVGAGLLATVPFARAIALSVAVTLLHRLREALSALAERIQCLALRIDGGVGIALAQLAAGIAHRRIGLAEAVVVTVALIVRLTLVAGLALALLVALLPALALVAALALLAHAALGELLLQLLEPVAQALLVLLQIAHALVALLVAAHAVAPRILALLECLVAQLLLLANHVAEFVERLLHVAVALPRLRHLQVFQHLLELIE